MLSVTYTLIEKGTHITLYESIIQKGYTFCYSLNPCRVSRTKSPEGSFGDVFIWPGISISESKSRVCMLIDMRLNSFLVFAFLLRSNL